MQKTSSYLFYILILATYITIIFSPAFFNKGPLLQTDQAMWTAVAHLWKKDVVPSQQWFCGTITDRAGAGQTLGEIYSLSLFLPWILSTFFSAATSVKIAMLLSALLFIIAFFFLACSYMTKFYAFLCSLVLLSPIFDNLVAGMWYVYFSLGCAFVFWLSCKRFYLFKTRWAVITAIIFFSLTIYSHTTGVMLCIAVFSSYTILYFIFYKNFQMKHFMVFLVIPIIGLMIAFPQVQSITGFNWDKIKNRQKDVTQIESKEEKLSIPQQPFYKGFMDTLPLSFALRTGVPEGEGYKSKTQYLITSINNLTVLFLFIIGIYVLFQKRDINKLLPILFLIILTIILTSKAYNYLNMHSGILEDLSVFYYRFEVFAKIYLILMSGFGLAYLFNRSKNTQKIIWKMVTIILAISFVLIAVRTPKKIFIDKTNQFMTFDASFIAPDIREMWMWLNKNVNSSKERIYFEDTYDSLQWNNSDYYTSNNTHVFALTSIYTDISQVSGFCEFINNFSKAHEGGRAGQLFGKIVDVEFSHNPTYYPMKFSDNQIDSLKLLDNLIYDRMKLLNCRYIVVYSDKTKRRLKNVPFLELAAKFDKFFIFKNTKMESAWAYKVGTGEKVQLIKHSPIHYELITDGQADDLVHISVAYRSKWKAFYETNEIPIVNSNQLIQIHLPDHGKQVIHLKYIIDRKTPLMFISAGVISLLLLINFTSTKHGRW